MKKVNRYEVFKFVDGTPLPGTPQDHMDFYDQEHSLLTATDVQWRIDRGLPEGTQVEATVYQTATHDDIPWSELIDTMGDYFTGFDGFTSLDGDLDAWVGSIPNLTEKFKTAVSPFIMLNESAYVGTPHTRVFRACKPLPK